MKKSLRSLVALFALGAVALTARAEPALKILVVDLAKIYDNHYRTQEQQAKINADQDKAREAAEQMRKEGNALVEEFKNLQEQATNAALTAEAKQKAQNDAQKKYEEIQSKQGDLNNFIQQTQQSLQQRMQNFRTVLLEEISKIATDIAKRKGATLLLDKAGPTLIGISNLVYVDQGFDITDEVMKEIDKSRPAGAAAPAASSSASSTSNSSASTAAPSGSGPTINLPITPKK
jgi:outer membrane protein